MSFESELLLGRFRARGTRLFRPTLFLAIAAFLLSFLYARLAPGWQLNLLYAATGLIALFGFLIPVIRYLTSWTEITTARLVTRSGLWGQNYQSLSLSEIDRVEYSNGVVTLFVIDGTNVELRRLPKPRFIAQEISNLVSKNKPKEF